MCVPFTGTEAWTKSIGYKIIDPWRPWLINNEIAGYPLFFKYLIYETIGYNFLCIAYMILQAVYDIID